MSSHQFTLTQLRNPSALNPLIPANLPAHSGHLQSPTSSCLLLTNSQPPLPHFPPVPLPFLHFSPSYITAHSIPISAVSRNPAGFQDAQPSLELACSPARVPGAPRSHASSQRRPGSPPPPPPSFRTALRRSAAPRQPESRCPERTRRIPRPAPQAHYRPRRGRLSRQGLRHPRCHLSPCARRKTEARRSPGPSRSSPGCRVCGPAGRRRGTGGSALGHPGQQSPEPPRLRLTIGSGCGALPLIGAGASWPGPGAAWEMESTPGPRPMACRESEAASAAKP